MRVVTWEELAEKALDSDALFGAWLHHAGRERSVANRLDLVLLDEKVAVETVHHVLMMSPCAGPGNPVSDRGYCDLTLIAGGQLLADITLVGKKVSLDLLRIEGLEDEEPIEIVSADGTISFRGVPMSRLYDIREEVLLTVR